MTDEEVHAIAALLRGNSTIAELNLRGNEVLRGVSVLRALASRFPRSTGGVSVTLYAVYIHLYRLRSVHDDV